jgi:cytochrome c oxidase assembly factor CtaG
MLCFAGPSMKHRSRIGPMRIRWSLLAFCLVMPLCSPVKADTKPQPLSLKDYRAKATLPAACSQVGGTLVYGGMTPDCKLLTVTSKVPSASTTPGRAIPITAKH